MRISDWSSDVCSSDLRESIGFVNLHLIEARRPAACFAAIQGVARGAYGEPRIWSGQPQQVLRRELDFPNHVLRRFGERDAIPQAGFHRIPEQIGSEACRERVCQYVSISVVAVTLKKKNNINKQQNTY